MQVPEGWEKLSFGEVVSIKTKKFNPKKETMVLPCIELEHIDQETGRLLGSIPSAQISSMKSMFNRGDVLFGKLRPYLKKFAQPNFDGVCSTEIWVLKNNKQIEKSYLFYLIQTNRFLYEANKSTGSKMPRADWEVVEQHVICLPPLPEQTKIAEILSTWDNAITTTEQLLANSQQQKKALMQQLLTGKKRLLDDNGVRFSGEWKWSKIQEVGMVVTGSTPPKSDENNYGGDVLWATAEDFTGKYVSDTKIKLSDKGSTKARIVPKGSVLVTCIASIGKNAIANEDMGTNQQINAVVVSDSFSNEFFYYQIEFNVNKLISIAGVTAVPIVNKSSFQQVKLIFPVLEEQQKIAAVLSTADQEITALQQKLEALKQEKKALMQQLLTGKKRVKITREE